MTAITSELPLRPRPQCDESLMGYILRVLNTNGYNGLTVFNTLFGTRVQSFQSITTNCRSFSKLRAAMQVRLRLTSQQIHQCFEDELLHTYDDYRAVNDIRVAEPKICLHCLAEGKPIHRRWRLAHVTHCELHNVKLAQSCPCCGELFRWLPSLLETCPHCDMPWDSAIAEEGICGLESLPIWQQHEQQLEGEALRDFLRALYSMVALAMRLCDMQITVFRAMPTDIDDAHALMGFSYRLLTNRKFRNNHLARRIDTWRTQGQLNVLNESTLANLHSELPYLAQKAPLEKNEYWDAIDTNCFQTSKVSTARLVDNQPPTDLHYQLGLWEAAKLIGIEPKAMGRLAKLGLLKNVLGLKTPKYSQVDVRALDSMLVNLQKRLQPYSETLDTKLDIISFESLSATLVRFKLTIAEVLDMIMLEQCHAYTAKADTSFSLNRILIDKDSFTDALDKRFLSELPNNCSPFHLCKHYYLSEAQLNQLLEFADEECSLGDASDPNVQIEIVRKFEPKYLVLNRYCRLRGLKCREINEKLEALGHSPAFTASTKSLCFAYPKSEKLASALQAIRKELG